jgi:hypothetical protein
MDMNGGYICNTRIIDILEKQYATVDLLA